jgi:hypothetical protein
MATKEEALSELDYVFQMISDEYRWNLDLPGIRGAMRVLSGPIAQSRCFGQPPQWL